MPKAMHVKEHFSDGTERVALRRNNCNGPAGCGQIDWQGFEA